MDSLCRVCIEKAEKCISLNTRIESSSSLTFLDFLNKCTNINVCESDKLPQSLCSICSTRLKTFYSFAKLAEKSNLILREALENSIATGRYYNTREISCEEIAIRNEENEEEFEDFSKEGSFQWQTTTAGTESPLYNLDIVKEEPCVSEGTLLVDFKNVEINEDEKFHKHPDHPQGSSKGPEDILSCIDRCLAGIGAEHSESEDEVPISLLKRRMVKNEDESEPQISVLSTACSIPSNVKKKIGKATVIKEATLDPQSNPRSDSLICDLRHRVFKTITECKDHIITEHGCRNQVSIKAKNDSLEPNLCGHTEKTYKCIECDIIFHDREEFRTHCRNHVYENKHQCNICGKKFARHKYLYQHLVIHEEERKYQCSICGKGFKHHTSLYRHLKIHSGKKPFECKICGKKFGFKGLYERHLRVHLNIRYTCPQCGKVYKTKKFLLSHIDEHAGKKLVLEKHECEICSKQFSAKRYLDVHMELHLGITQECEQCGKVFRNSHTLSRHMKWHTNPKPFKCKNCGKSLARKCTYTRHMEICKAVKNSTKETITIEEPSYHSQGNKEILLQIT